MLVSYRERVGVHLSERNILGSRRNSLSHELTYFHQMDELVAGSRGRTRRSTDVAAMTQSTPRP